MLKHGQEIDFFGVPNILSIDQDPKMGLLETINDGINWIQDFTKPVLGFSKISLIKHKDKPKKLYIPSQDEWKHIVIENPIKRGSIEEYKESYRIFFNHNISEDHLNHTIHMARKIGLKFSDDPLKDFLFITRSRLEIPAIEQPPKIVLSYQNSQHTDQSYTSDKF